MLAGLRAKESIAALCRRESISESVYCTWSKKFLEAGKQRLVEDTVRQATLPEVKELRSESAARKQVIADLTLENCLFKKARLGMGSARGHRGAGQMSRVYFLFGPAARKSLFTG